jgi:hypothetical protein
MTLQGQWCSRGAATALLGLAFFLLVSGVVYGTHRHATLRACVRLIDAGLPLTAPPPDLVMLPPSSGFTVDALGHSRMAMFMAGTGQYVTEGLAAGFLLSTGSLAWLVVLRVGEGLCVKNNARRLKNE